MDPEQLRHSLCLGRDESSASGLSALRASARSPSFRRLSLRKSRSSSCSTTDSVSILSTESHVSPPSSCVTRDTSRDECAFHRFMVWVAVKRNECVRMTPSERLECPLLRCRKRFATHELMLRHLYACDELDSGEYWCYDCERPERFADTACKRCPANATKRRKIMSMARSFFTSLGHKSRRDGSSLKSLPEGDTLVPPPSYESLDLQLSELPSAGMIPELDSTEVGLEPVPAPASTPTPTQNLHPEPEPEPMLAFSDAMPQSTPHSIFPTELDTRLSLAAPHDSAVESWVNGPMAYLPSETTGVRCSVEERRMKTRSKTLAPSTSLRSNASNSSTNTTNTMNSLTSTDTTDSTNTADTVWSEPWSAVDAFGSELDPPLSGTLCPSKFDGGDMGMGGYDGALNEDILMRDPAQELPGDSSFFDTLPGAADNLASTHDLLSFGNLGAHGQDSSMGLLGMSRGMLGIGDITPDLSMGASPSSNEQDSSMGILGNPDGFMDVASYTPDLSMGASPSTNEPDSSMPMVGNISGLMGVGNIIPSLNTEVSPCSNEQKSSMGMLGDPTGKGIGSIAPNLSAEASPSSEPKLSFPPRVDPSSLVASIWETLQAHVSSSKAKLRPMTNNGLAARFLALDPRTVGSYGHATLKAVLQGRSPESELHLLCYVHIAYAYFLVVHQEDADGHSKTLFTQALGYAVMFGIPLQAEYLEIACVVWEPGVSGKTGSTNMVPLELQSAENPLAMGFCASLKGKGPDNGLHGNDALLAVVQHLLDEFEYSILPAKPPLLSDAPSPDPWTPRAVDASLMPPGDAFPSFGSAVGDTVNFINQRFGAAPGLASALQLVNQRVSKECISSVRRAELEILQAARGPMSLPTAINQYAPFVRKQCDILYSTQATGMAWRVTHYEQAIDLIEAMMSSIVPGSDYHKPPDTSDLDEFLTLSSPLENSAGVSPDYTTPEYQLSPGTNTPASLTAGKDSASPEHRIPHTRKDAEPNPDLTAPQAGPSPPAPAAEKVEASICCEICGYRPRGSPDWFKGSMAKHKKTQHRSEPRIYKCPFPGCTSKYKNRPDNLRQHQIDKGHFVNGEGPGVRAGGKSEGKRESKRRKVG